MNWLLELLARGLPGGVLQRDADGAPLIMISNNGTTSLTAEGIRRALEKWSTDSGEVAK
jgi:hypothetical protein